MKSSLFHLAIFSSLAGCAAYVPPSGQATVTLRAEMPDLNEHKGYADDNGIIQFYDEGDLELNSRLGFHRVSASNRAGDFQIPAGRGLIINAIYNIATFGSLVSCSVPFPLPAEFGSHYNVVVRYSPVRRQCTAEVSTASPDGNILKQLGKYIGSTVEKKIRVQVQVVRD